ncbi:DUF4245 family protein, partial [Actinomadura adrarensis]
MTEKTSAPQETDPEASTQDARQSAPSRGTVQSPGPVQVSPGVYKRLTTGLGGFTIATLACLLLVGLIYLITPRSEEELLPTVDYSPQLWAIRADAPYTSYAPQGLSAGWRPTSSRLHGLNADG